MPTDENNGVVSQNQQTNFNQQVDPNLSGNQPVQNSGSSDDFDFSFDDSGGPANNVDDAHLFTNPENSDNQGVSNYSTNNDQGRTGMFKTPEEQENSSQMNQSTDVDSFLSDIDPNDVQTNNDVSGEQGEIFNQQQNESQDGLDKGIQDMISFDNDSKQQEEASHESMVDIQANTDVQIDNLQDSNVQEVVNETQNNVGSDDTQTVADSGNTQISGDSLGDTSGDDWLQQEDKEVEEAFGQQNTTESSSLLNVNMSGNDVAQNVENIMANTTETIPQNNVYVPNENEYSQMSNLLNTSGTGQVDLNNVNNPVVENMGSPVVENMGNPVVENMGNPVVENMGSPVVENMGNPVVENMGSPVVENMGSPVVENMGNPIVENMGNPIVENMGNPVVENMGNPVVENMGNNSLNFGGVPINSDVTQVNNPGGVDQNVGFGLGEINASMTENPVQNSPLNLDSIEQDIQNLSVGSAVIQQENQNMDVNQGQQMPGQFQVQNGQTVPQNMPIKKRKKQSGFKAIGIFIGVIVILGGLGFAATKMFPDKFSLDAIFGGNKIIEYVDNSGNNSQSDSKNINDEDLNDNIGDDDNIDVVEDENSIGDEIFEIDDENGEDGELGEDGQSDDLEDEGDDLDPNSLAAQLSDESTGNVISGSVTGDSAEEISGGIASSGENSDSSFDPFAEVNDLFDDTAENKKKLEEYISKGELYKDLGIVNNNSMISKYGDYIVVTAQAQLTKLENGEEIDTNVFVKFDDILEKIANLSN